MPRKHEKILATIEGSKCEVIDNAEFEIALLKDTFGLQALIISQSKNFELLSFWVHPAGT